MGASSIPALGAVSRRKLSKLSLSDLTPPAHRPSRTILAWAVPHAVRHLFALDLAKVPHRRAPSLSASGAVWSQKWPYLSLEYLTQPAQRLSSSRISPAGLTCSATPPCLGFGEGPARGGPLPPHLRGSLEWKVALKQQFLCQYRQTIGRTDRTGPLGTEPVV